MNLLPLLGILTLLPPGEAAEVKPGKALKAAAQRYRDALARARWSPGTSSLGALYSQARLMGRDRTPEVAAQTKDFLAQAPPAEKEAFLRDLAGLQFGAPEEAPVPDFAFLLDLSHVSKQKESESFFHLVKKIYSPAFRRPYEDPAGCTRLGSGEAVGVIKRVESAEKNLRHFRDLLTSERSAALKALEAGCACLGPEESEREIKSFIESFPKDNAVPPLKAQLAKIRAKDPSLVFHCNPASSVE
jgi:hypothetical protein